MSATSPSPNSPPQPATTSPPPQTSSPPPQLPLTPPPTTPSQPNANPPESTNSTSDPPPPLSPPITPLPPPPVESPPPPLPTSPPPMASPPPLPSSPPPPSNDPPPSASPPPPSDPPPSASPPPPPSDPPPSDPPSDSPPPPPSDPPPADPPSTSPPPPPSDPPPSASSPPPPSTRPPENSPPPPRNSPRPPTAPIRNPPPPPSRRSPPPGIPSRRPPPPGRRAPPSLIPTPPPENSPPPEISSPPILGSPPPASTVFPPPPSPSSSSSPRVPISPARNESVPVSLNRNSGMSAGGVAAIGAVAAILVLSLFGLGVWFLAKRRRNVSGLRGHVTPSSNSDSAAFLKANSTSTTVPLIGSASGSGATSSPRGNSRPFFAFEELARATDGFSEENLLGEGGFGSVYKGVLPDGLEIAVKQLKIGGGQGEREFKAEVEIISRVHHRYLVSLVGYCIADTRRLLVYNYVPNNNLYYHLHGEGMPVMEWSIRVKVAAGAARGIAYLHEDCNPRIIHRDIKSSNILLDNNFEAQVSDFGLAKLALNEADTHITTRVMGTFGYMAPEYASSGKLTEKSDVYSYGVVLLELITGRKPVDPSQPLGDESLVEWARVLLGEAIDSGKFGNLVDPKLESNFVQTEMLRMIEIAATCVRHSAAKRPRMGQVVRAFDGLGSADLTNGVKVGESEVFNSAQQSEEIRWFRKMAFDAQDCSSKDFLSQGSSSNTHSKEKRESDE